MKNQMLNSPKYRHEYKYFCNNVQREILKARAKGLLKPDSHVGAEGLYRIRSLYFDTIDNMCFYDTENGTDDRDKYRIRIYNEDTSIIRLEKKSKKRQMTLKKSCPISEADCRRLMMGQYVELTEDMEQAQRELLTELRIKNLKPAVVVEYVRYPFIEKNGNVRITFDEQISSSNDIANFLERNLVKRPIMGLGGGILEVKWDEFLPDYIKAQMEFDALQWTSFSKYYLCRKYNTIGGIIL